MMDPVRVIVGGLAVIGFSMIIAYLQTKTKPKEERADLFWGYSHITIKTGMIVFSVWAVAAFVYQVFREFW